MNDRSIMENLLLTTKGACDLYLHGTVEANTANVNNTFNCALKDTLGMQTGLYQKMAAKGWYPSQQVEQQKIDQVRQKFSNAQ
jgi:spore coat protein CotF